jgi:hypothetical protein
VRGRGQGELVGGMMWARSRGVLGNCIQCAPHEMRLHVCLDLTVSSFVKMLALNKAHYV